MWPKTFDERLADWSQLRSQAAALDTESCLRTINSWWFRTPWCAYHLHWDDQPDWPDPWQLLSDNIYCSVARGLGIMYTVALLDRSDLHDACMIEVDGDNLVQVSGEKYILNWTPDSVVNITPSIKNFKRRLTLEQVKSQIK